MTIDITVVSADPVPAKWEAQQVRLKYYENNTIYTCDGIRTKLKALLLAIGARDDVRIETKCHGFTSELQPHIKALLAFAIPAVADKTATAGEIFPAEWRELKIRTRTYRSIDVSDYELIRQFKKQILPRLGISADNGKRQYSASRIGFTTKFEVLMPVVEETESTQD